MFLTAIFSGIWFWPYQCWPYLQILGNGYGPYAVDDEAQQYVAYRYADHPNLSLNQPILVAGSLLIQIDL